MNAKAVVRAERAALCDTFERLGADAPTLCAGWATADLAAHLVVRERDPLAGPGIVLGGPFGRYTEHAMARQRGRGYDRLLARLRGGPPGYMVATMAGVNVNENWIHHEDARRANGEEPRPDDPATSAILLGVLERLGRLQTRRVKPYGVTIVLPDQSEHVLRAGSTTARVRGPVGECVLYLSGRRDAARVTLDGDDAAVEALRTARLGV